jgi:hypothetical protein
MSSGLRMALLGAVALLVLYWGFVLVMRNMGTELPDPTHLLPISWRPYP